jgi:hypothetical protein
MSTNGPLRQTSIAEPTKVALSTGVRTDDASPAATLGVILVQPDNSTPSKFVGAPRRTRPRRPCRISRPDRPCGRLHGEDDVIMVMLPGRAVSTKRRAAA